MNARIAATVAIVSICVPVWAQSATSRPSERRAIVEKLAKWIAAPYNPSVERGKFFKAAGVDGELDRKEFDADRGRDGLFLHEGDRWEAMLPYDKNTNLSFDWFETDAYRRDLRERLLTTFDADKDGKLTGEELQKAARSLASGRATGTAGRGRGGRRDRGGRGRRGGGRRWRRGGAFEANMLKQYDADGDGTLSEEERREMFREMQNQRRQRRLDRFDTDGDGKLSDEERAAIRNRRGGRWREMRRKWELRDFDANSDGEIDETERKAIRAFGQKFMGLGKEVDRRFNDLDGNGEVTREERRQAQQQWRKVVWKGMVRFSKYLDTNGDGKMDPDEMRTFGERTRGAVIGWLDEYRLKFDADNNGRLDEPERVALVSGLREEVRSRLDRFDADSNGTMSPTEAMDMAEDFLQKDLGMATAAKKANAAGAAKATATGVATGAAKGETKGAASRRARPRRRRR